MSSFRLTFISLFSAGFSEMDLDSLIYPSRYNSISCGLLGATVVSIGVVPAYLLSIVTLAPLGLLTMLISPSASSRKIVSCCEIEFALAKITSSNLL